MKLIDILVRELPAKGGWPEGVRVISQHLDGGIFFDKAKVLYRTSRISISQSSDGWGPGNGDCYADNSVLRDQYEAALAQRQPAESWNGEGLPPVGCLVDVQMYRGCGSDCNLEWYSEKVLGRDGDIIIVASGCRAGDYEGVKPHSYRPPRTETDKKRDEAVDAMNAEWRAHAGKERDGKLYSIYEIIYDAIAEGKISGVKLED